MAASDLVPALQTAVEGFNTVVEGKQPTLDAKLPTAQTALDGARESRNGALVARDATNLSRDAAYRDFRSAKANLDHQDLSALAASKAVNAVDVFIYDTSKDSDGGAWRKRCAKTSWFNEPLNTATRGARREFPAVAVIVADFYSVTIYDGDDPALPVWMRFTQTGGSVPHFWRTARGVKTVTARDGKVLWGVYLGEPDASSGLLIADFVTDSLSRRNSSYLYGSERIADRLLGAQLAIVQGATGIAHMSVNDVAITVFPDTPIDPATGLPVPTIAVATEGGVSVINDDGSVADGADVLSMVTVGFDELDGLFFARTGAANHFTYAPKEAYRAGDGFGFGLTSVISNFPSAGFSGIVQPRLIARSDKGYVFGSGLNAYNVVAGVARHVVGPGKSKADFAEGMSALLTSTYNTGWLPGDIRGAFLADTDATDLVGGTDADRSVKNNPLTVNGTITRTPVATGAELVAYSGFSAGNYIEQVDNADLDFGTGDYCFMGWVSADAWSGRAFFDMFNGSNVGLLVSGYGGGLRVFTYTGVGNLAMALISGLPIGLPIFIALKRTNVVTYELFVNGEMVGTSTIAGNTDLSGPLSLLIGKANPNGPLNTYVGGASEVALFRISATAPSADQIRRIYEDEKVLFQENAACTLYGASDAVIALAHDPDTGLLHVGTSAGRSVFKGLRRVANTTQPVTTAISAANGMVIEQ